MSDWIKYSENSVLYTVQHSAHRWRIRGGGGVTPLGDFFIVSLNGPASAFQRPWTPLSKIAGSAPAQ